jgi:argininosuccinate synthase
MTAPDKPTPFTVYFAEGVPVKLEVEGKIITGSLEIFKEANEIGRANGKAIIRIALDLVHTDMIPGIGRVDIVESRFIGKSASRASTAISYIIC